MDQPDIAPVNPPPLKGWFRKPPRLWSMLPMLAIAGFWLYQDSDPPGFVPDPPIACLAVPLALALFADNVVRLLVAITRASFNPRQWRWYAALLVAALALWAWRTDWPLRWRFERNRSSFEAAATELLRSGKPSKPLDGDNARLELTHCNRTIGGYRVIMTCVVPEQHVVYLATNGFFRGTWGFVYNPDGRVLDFNLERRSDDDIVITRPLTDGWMTFTWATP